jgi:hypothetical protein
LSIPLLWSYLENITSLAIHETKGKSPLTGIEGKTVHHGSCRRLKGFYPCLEGSFDWGKYIHRHRKGKGSFTPEWAESSSLVSPENRRLR